MGDGGLVGVPDDLVMLGRGHPIMPAHPDGSCPLSKPAPADEFEAAVGGPVFA